MRRVKKPLPIGPGSESPLARSSASLRHTSYPPQNRGVRLSESAASMVAIFARTAGSRNRSATRATIWCPSSAHASTDRGSRAIKQTTSENTTRRTVETRAGSLNDRDVLALGFVRVRNLSNELETGVPFSRRAPLFSGKVMAPAIVGCRAGRSNER